MKTLGFWLLLIVAPLAVPGAALANPFTNGNFESPGVSSGTYKSISDDHASAPTAWSVGGTTTNVAEFYENGAFGVIGISGPNAIGFGGNGTTGANISQTFDTTIGQSYNINYFVTAQQGSGPQSYSAQVLDGTSGLSIATVNSTIPDVTPGQSFTWFSGPTLNFLALSSSSTIRFTDTSNGGAALGVNWALDGVSVTAAVPEPETYILMFAGLGVIGSFVRRNKRLR